MRALFADVPEAVDNTAVIAEKCNFDFEFGNTKLPFYETPNGMNHFDYFKQCCLFSKVESHKIDLGLELGWNFKEVQKYLQRKFFHFCTMCLYKVVSSAVIF